MTYAMLADQKSIPETLMRYELEDIMRELSILRDHNFAMATEPAIKKRLLYVAESLVVLKAIDILCPIEGEQQIWEAPILDDEQKSTLLSIADTIRIYLEQRNDDGDWIDKSLATARNLLGNGITRLQT